MRIRDERGQTLIIMIVALPLVFVPVLSLVVDGSSMQRAKIVLQNDVDSAALAGQGARCGGAPPAEAAAEAKRYAGDAREVEVDVSDDGVTVSADLSSPRLVFRGATFHASASAGGCPDPDLVS